MKGIEAFAEVRRLIIVAAHPDDLETLCGGTVALLAQQGVQIFSVNCTLGDIGAQDAALSRSALASIRLAETDAAAQILGISRTFNLDHHDGELVPNLKLRAQIARLYRLTQADTLGPSIPIGPARFIRTIGQQDKPRLTPTCRPKCRSTGQNSSTAGGGPRLCGTDFSVLHGSRPRRFRRRQRSLRVKLAGLHRPSQPVSRR